ncbi:winged helix-turn-helix transcriptional regulator [Candidatus Woesearchaeota archaeon]|nr:winged helix-turn-helix transcriptional regulator [Candidatus Woesearchaeota archaeon]
MKKILKQPYQQFFGTLANQVRIDIIEILNTGEQNVSKLTKQLPYDQSTISHNLSRLLECGFVSVKQNGVERVYTLNTKTIKPLLELMHNHMHTYCRHVVMKRRMKTHGSHI